MTETLAETEVGLETATGDTVEAPSEIIGAAVPPPDAGATVGTKPDKPDEDVEDDVLDLSTLVPSRKKLRLPTGQNDAEGKPVTAIHELRLLDDFGIIDQQKLLSWSRRFEALWNKEDGDLTENEAAVMTDLMNRMFNVVLDAPQEVRDAVPEHLRSRVVTAFTLVPLIERQRQQQEAEAEAEAKAKGQLTSGS